ncbi:MULTISPECIES: DNA-processing protein DprA [unclassified Providencia]|uniref:DNA-processing protein DprA n=1 Tax=unclassified Providencia TaxID=2633465 RepID=UPI0023493DE7|nr:MULTISPECIES: DNA-processing protein DprA [unclassified Providencia]
MDSQEIWLRMSQVSRLSPHKALRIINKLLLLEKVSLPILRECGLNELQCLQFQHFSSTKLTQTIKWLEKEEHQLITFYDSHYPLLLKQISNFPLVLFVIGQRELIATAQIAIVGSRQTSAYGRKWAELFAKEFTRYGLTITSGLAFGIDVVSHRAALNEKGKTIAVLGSGLANIYPKQHIFWAEKIKEEGALISEYLPHTPPLPKQFPRRNRIISGLSKATVVIEAGMKSGSLITARYAIEQNRDLFTIPAPLGDPAFSGNHWLLQQGAYLLVDPEDIKPHLEAGLNWLPVESLIKEEINSEFNLTENKILSMVEYHPLPADVIAERAQQPITEVTSILTELEIDGVIASVAGGYIKLS